MALPRFSRAFWVPNRESRNGTPFPPTSESVAAACRCTIFHCQLCHGTEGLGDGPASVGLNPPVADLVVHVPLHPDRALFDFIHDGIQGAAMPALGETIADPSDDVAV